MSGLVTHSSPQFVPVLTIAHPSGCGRRAANLAPSGITMPLAVRQPEGERIGSEL
jgi:hypothetical protein